MDCSDEQGQMGPVCFPSLLAWVLANHISLLCFCSKIKNESKCLSPGGCCVTPEGCWWMFQPKTCASLLLLITPLPTQAQPHTALPLPPEPLPCYMHPDSSFPGGVCWTPTETAALSSDGLWTTSCWALPLQGASLVLESPFSEEGRMTL